MKNSILQSMADDSLADLRSKMKSQLKPLVVHTAKYLFIQALPEHYQDWVKDIQHRILPRIEAVTSKGLKIGFVKEEARAYVFDLNLPLLLKKEYNPSFQLRQPPVP